MDFQCNYIFWIIYDVKQFSHIFKLTWIVILIGYFVSNTYLPWKALVILICIHQLLPSIYFSLFGLPLACGLLLFLRFCQSELYMCMCLLSEMKFYHTIREFYVTFCVCMVHRCKCLCVEEVIVFQRLIIFSHIDFISKMFQPKVL